jgi:hypothetical protein
VPKRRGGAESTNTTECPGEVIERDAVGCEIGRRPCVEIITFGTTMCRACKTLFAPGSLMAFRIVAHAKKGIPRSWCIRFLKGD